MSISQDRKDQLIELVQHLKKLSIVFNEAHYDIVKDFSIFMKQLDISFGELAKEIEQHSDDISYIHICDALDELHRVFNKHDTLREFNSSWFASDQAIEPITEYLALLEQEGK